MEQPHRQRSPAFVALLPRARLWQTGTTAPSLVSRPSSKRRLMPAAPKWTCCMTSSTVLDNRTDRPHGVVRIAIPSKGGMFDKTRDLLTQIGCEVVIQNPRQYVASLRGIPDVEIWLQRPPDIARKVREGVVDLGFCGTDLTQEYGGSDGEIVTIHEDLKYGACRLAIGVPMSWTTIKSVEELVNDLSSEGHPPLRVATKFQKMATAFFERVGIDNYELVYMDGALEASTQMGTADCIVDLVSSGVTLRENLLKEIDGGTVLDSCFQLVGNRETFLSQTGSDRERLLGVTRQLVERIEAFNAGKNCYNLIANIRGSSPGDVARKLGSATTLSGMDGPTISTVVPPFDSTHGMYAVGIIVPQESLYSAVSELRRIGGSGVCVLPVTFVFERDSIRWQRVVEELDLEEPEY